MAITGVIRPPPEIRAVADRTASYVAKNGRTFEARILTSAKGKTPKFAFLQPTSPFHAYYEDRIKFYENGGDDAEEKEAEEKKEEPKEPQKKVQESKARKTEKTQVASAIDPIAKALIAQRARISQARTRQPQSEQQDGTGEEAVSSSDHPAQTITPPPPLELVNILAPANLSLAQLEVMQLVAQFAAMDGKGGSFLYQLSTREWSNREFAFCQPRHSDFAYFSALVDAYRKLSSDWVSAVDEKVEKKDSDKFHHLQAALEEAAYRAEYQRDRNQQRSKLEEGEVISIDWHDFVVVETIDFPVDEKVELSMLPPPPPTTKNTSAYKPAAGVGEEMDESDDDEGETIRVVPSYTPRVVSTANPHTAMAIDPITGKSVPVADVPEHLRIQLLDPKWAEERKKFQDKQKESNLVSGDAIVSNLSRYSQAKGDLFGKSEQELLDKEKDSKRRLEQANRIIREQANQPQSGFPTISSAGPLVPHSVEPEAKRIRLDVVAPTGGREPLPPPLQPITTIAPPPPPPETDSPKTSGDPLADALMNAASTNDVDSEGAKLLTEDDFIATLPRPEVTLQIRVPNDPTQMAWNFYGQILSLTVNARSTIKHVKTDFAQKHLNGMPINKIQLKDPGAGFYNNNDATLAALNIGPTATLELLAKTRGGRR